MCLLLLGTNVADDTSIYDLGALGYFVIFDEKTSVNSPCIPLVLGIGI